MSKNPKIRNTKWSSDNAIKSAQAVIDCIARDAEKALTKVKSDTKLLPIKNTKFGFYIIQRPDGHVITTSFAASKEACIDNWVKCRTPLFNEYGVNLSNSSRWAKDRKNGFKCRKVKLVAM